tara:strand:- start:396 stop:1493 length:1098 start_codon:yes stop_codon:yes gene_type:complete
MAAVGEFFALVGRTLSELTDLSGGAFALLQRDTALLVYALLVGVCLALLVFRRMRRSRAGEGRLVLPAVFGSAMFPKNHAASVRHVAYGLFLLGVIAFAFALADPHTALVEDEASYPGHRITMMIDASLSMNTAFATEQLAAGNTFLANVSAAEYFVKRRMEGPYQDLVSLVQFGNEAYIVTPFTNDYQNILLSISLVGTPEEYRRFPDHGTLIMKAISRGVQLFRSFDFLGATGNLIVIFSDGQDTHARFEDVTLDDIMQEAADNEIPVYFIRTAYDQELGDIISDQQWKLAVERTGGKFFPAENEAAILSAIHEIDALAKGRIRVKRYVAHEPRFQAFALMAVLLWMTGLAMTLGFKQFRRFA